MRVLVLCLLPLLGACAEPTFSNMDVPMGGVYGPGSTTTQSDHTVHLGNHTLRAVRPDATGHFPGDAAGLAHTRHHTLVGVGPGVHAPGVPHARDSAHDGKYSAPSTGKYEPAATQHHAPVASARRGTHDGRPANCVVMSRVDPTWVGERFLCDLP